MRTKIALASVSLLMLLVFLPLTQGAGETSPCAATFDTSPPFTDYCYHQGVWYVPDTPNMDVLILPGTGEWSVRDTQLAEQSLAMWDSGIHAQGASWLSGLHINSYTVGFDSVPPAALADPEVIVALTTETTPFVLFGVAVLQPLSFCHGISPDMSWSDIPGFHQHPGSPLASFAMPSCNGGGMTCYVVNTSFVTSVLPDANDLQWMYDLISHEVGHCLSLGHVGDADTESTDDSLAYPDRDIMSYENDGIRAASTHCVSNLNVRVIEKAYSSMLNPPGSTAVAPAPAAYVHMSPASYSQPACPQSTAGILDTGYLLTANPLGL